jgi:hypothetical protein
MIDVKEGISLEPKRDSDFTTLETRSRRSRRNLGRGGLIDEE